MFRSLFFAFAALAIVACSQRGLQDEQAAQLLWASEQQSAAQFDTWDIHARAVIKLKGELYHIGIGWQRAPESFKMLLEAPFGQGVFRVESNQPAEGKQSMKLSLPDGQVFFDESAEALLTEVFGWSIPVSGLKSWIKGLPLLDTDYNFDLRADGRLKSLRQDGWLINYLEYFAGDTSPQGLPRKMYLKHANLAMKIVIDRWRQIESEVNSPVVFPDFD